MPSLKLRTAKKTAKLVLNEKYKKERKQWVFVVLNVGRVYAREKTGAKKRSENRG